MEKLAYTIGEVMELTGIGKTKINEEIANGNLDARKFGKRTLIPADALEKWFKRLPKRVTAKRTQSTLDQ